MPDLGLPTAKDHRRSRCVQIFRLTDFFKVQQRTHLGCNDEMDWNQIRTEESKYNNGGTLSWMTAF